MRLFTAFLWVAMYIVKKLKLYIKKLNVLKSSSFKKIQWPKLDHNLWKIARFLCMIQVCTQKYRRIFLNTFLSYLSCRQNWLHLHVGHHHFVYITKLTKNYRNTLILHSWDWRAA
jgi:hypothetical protein